MLYEPTGQVKNLEQVKDKFVIFPVTSAVVPMLSEVVKSPEKGLVPAKIEEYPYHRQYNKMVDDLLD